MLCLAPTAPARRHAVITLAEPQSRGRAAQSSQVFVALTRRRQKVQTLVTAWRRVTSATADGSSRRRAQEGPRLIAVFSARDNAGIRAGLGLRAVSPPVVCHGHSAQRRPRRRPSIRLKPGAVLTARPPRPLRTSLSSSFATIARPRLKHRLG